MTNSTRETMLETATGVASGSVFVITSEMVSGWAKAGSAVVGFLILCVTFTHAFVKLKRFIRKEP